ncbi:MAG: serine hydrolase domain-containing protein [Planctomycetota bacterium]|jgi:CubicO group peptidase (beta-lactamase class C family)
MFRGSLWLGGALVLCIGIGAAALLIADGETPTLDDLQPYPTPAGDGPGDLGPFLAEAATRLGIPALGAVVLDSEGTIALGVGGRRFEPDGPPVTRADAWHIGSCTKAMTATLAALLVADGTVSWDLTVAEAFPERADLDPAWERVRLRDLLTNSGGVKRNDRVQKAFRDALAGSTPDRDGPAQRDRMIEALLSSPPALPPRTQYHYSNFGFAVAGVMLERAAGQPFEDLMRERLFVPLGMTSAGYGAPKGETMRDQPWGHRGDGTPVEPGPRSDNPAMITAAGRVHLTLEDWATFVRFHLRGFQGEETRLPADAFRTMYTPHAGAGERYAMGWVVTDQGGPGTTTLVHTGSNTMWYAQAWVAVEPDLAVLVVANRGDLQAETDRVVWRLVEDQVRRRRE